MRVEATSTTTTVLRWTYGGAAVIDVYRSTDGAAYTRITDNVTNVAVGTTSYTDSGLSPATKYWYKLSDDVGSTFSSIVTVWTHVCPGSQDGSAAFALPRFSGEPDPAELSAQLDDMAQRIEEVLGTRTMEPSQCTKCPVDGALILDCSGGCNDFVVVADQDINSISINWCENGSGGGSGTGGQIGVNFVVPPNSSVNICGWPSGTGFTGDECSGSPIITGAKPKQKKVELTCKCMDLAQGAIGFTPGYPCRCVEAKSNNLAAAPGPCGCTTSTGALTIKSCTTGNSLGCSGTKSLTVGACGGREPYTWSSTGSVVLSTTTGAQTTVTPPANAGSGVAGVAYALFNKFTATAGGFCENWIAKQEFSCNDVAGSFSVGADPHTLPETCGNGDITSINQLSCKGCTTTAFPCVGAKQCNGATGLGCNTSGAELVAGGTMCDKRTAPMIASGCAPCGVVSDGNTVSVTDSIGTVATIVVRA